MSQDIKTKVQNSLIFHQSDLWDSVMWIIEEAEKAEMSMAVAQSTDESKRSHQCGRAEGVQFVKQLLEDTRSEALKNVNRNNS